MTGLRPYDRIPKSRTDATDPERTIASSNTTPRSCRRSGSAFALVWLNLAGGIIGNEGNPANLMYAAVLAVGSTGAVLARFRPRGMAGALVATALAQGLAAIIALAAGWGQTFPVTAVFVALWLLSALLFLG